MNVSYGPFIARMCNQKLNATIEGTLSCGEWFSLSMHPAVMRDRDIHYFDILSATAWPHMTAHERSQLCVLIRKVNMAAKPKNNHQRNTFSFIRQAAKSVRMAAREVKHLRLQWTDEIIKDMRSTARKLDFFQTRTEEDA